MSLRRLLSLQLGLFGLLSITAVVAATGYGLGHAVGDRELSRFFGRLALGLGLFWFSDLALIVATTAYWLIHTKDVKEPSNGRTDQQTE